MKKDCLTKINMINQLKIIGKIPIFLIKTYKYAISPILPASCRFFPTCSEYSVSAYEKYGILKGSYLSLKRISKCHPFNSGGIDYLE